MLLKWAVDRFHPKLMMATAFGAEGCCILHMLAEIEPGVRVINLDTGYQFAETLELRERIKARYGIEVEYVRPELSVAEYEKEHGGPLYQHRSDQCCYDRKVLPLRKAVAGYDAWISSIRRDQTKALPEHRLLALHAARRAWR
jgi:phosphoadenosine phosphosulfate reductase